MRQVVLALPLLLAFPAGAALAQASGSYQNSCTDISQNGSTLIARCRAPNGSSYNSTLDLDRCGNIGVANIGGRLSCGNQRGTASPARGGGYGDDDTSRRRRYDNGYGQGYGQDRYGQGGYGQGGYGYGSRPRYRDPDDGYAPRRRYYSPDQE